MCMHECFACLYIHMCPWKMEEGVGADGTRIMVLSLHMGAGNGTQFLSKSSK